MRLIDADAADTSKILIRVSRDGNVYTVLAKEWLDSQPTVDAEPVRRGEWRTFNVPKKWNGATLRCSECNTGTTWRWNYCPNCGAKMDGSAENATV